MILSVIISGCAVIPNNRPAISPPPASGQEKEEEPPVKEDNPDEGGVEQSGNLIPGADFTDSNSEWGLYMESGGVATIKASGGKMRVHIADPGRVGHAVQLYCGGFDMLQGGQYHFSVTMTSDVERTVEWRIQVNGGDYHPYILMKDVSIGPEAKEITCDFTMDEASDPAPRMCFNLGDEGEEQGLEEHEITLEKISLELENSDQVKPPEITGELKDININQIGYLPASDKRAVIRLTGDQPSGFDIIDAESGKSVYSGKITPGIDKGSSGDKVVYADFSDFETPGRYRISVTGEGESYDFSIGNDVFDDALTDTLRMFYLQRCGCELTKELAGDFAHAACHTDEARIYGGKDYVEVPGGWHDAGDYGRYTVPAAKAVVDLMLAYENYPEAFKGSLNIPESGSDLPDILSEVKYELDWMLLMQGADGGVSHKVTGLNFDGFVKADECTEKLYLLPESKTATADFAAAMYMASRVYEPFDKDFAAKCQSAADRAMEAYKAHKDDRNYTNPSDVLTGEYGDGNSTDEFLWAVCEGYKTTGDARFEKMLDHIDLSRITIDEFGWEDVSGYAYYAYLTSDRPMNISIDVNDRFRKIVDGLKDTALNGESYGSTITDVYPWGSNMTIANNGMALLMANKIYGDDDYVLAAQRQLDYLLGTNCTSYCFLTGFGTQSPQHPHHRPSQAIGKCMKGMLVGGPDSKLEDPYAQAVLKGLPNARCYVDNEQTYSCNEITIYWNSPLVYLFAGLK